MLVSVKAMVSAAIITTAAISPNTCDSNVQCACQKPAASMGSATCMPLVAGNIHSACEAPSDGSAKLAAKAAAISAPGSARTCLTRVVSTHSTPAHTAVTASIAAISPLPKADKLARCTGTPVAMRIAPVAMIQPDAAWKPARTG
jgi:hypothetical protein